MPVYALLRFRPRQRAFCAFCDPFFRSSAVSAVPPFPPFRRSAVPPFRCSAVLVFRRSALRRSVGRGFRAAVPEMTRTRR